MIMRFTHHAKQKILLIQKYKFKISEEIIIKTVTSPLQRELRSDNTIIATSLLDEYHVLRVVYKNQSGIIIIITCYPGRRKVYGV